MFGYLVWKDFSNTTGGEVAQCCCSWLVGQCQEPESFTSKWMKVFLTCMLGTRLVLNLPK